ncbi:hypothetical protein DS2_11463 [Catenovulum agarivorans DS-2]|uniref:Uncharacterized protein n=1 Tax=Catenovulum agarivorans DS-2 TaxID=1328313 RepID=W7QLE0_9ALTE|nr:sporulation protein [Catenovulum agarivorans]EWH09747.1 hypothetical protein DS2_11463 [Catenovulum agarivorans DS-2]
MSFLKRILVPFTHNETAASMHWQLQGKTFTVGSDLTFSVDFIGGAVEQHVSNVQASLLCLLDDVSGDTQAIHNEIIRTDIDRNFFIPAKKTLQKFYSLHLPPTSPLSNDICRYKLNIELNTSSPPQYGLSAALTIGPSEQISIWFQVLKSLQFKRESHWNQPVKTSMQTEKYIQKFRYRKENFINGKSLDIIFRFEQYTEYLDVFVKSNFAHQAHAKQSTSETFRFTIDHADVSFYASKLLRQLRDN